MRWKTFLPRAFGNPDIIAAQGDALSPQESELVALIGADAGQQRALVVVSDVLCRVARARAKECAVQPFGGANGHVDQHGKGPNYYVREAGYMLPNWWPTDVEANYIESLDAEATVTTAAKAFTEWMNSPRHRSHILGEGFYINQENVGVGHWYDADAAHKHYWVFLSAPPEGKRDPK